uniref:VENN motif pre-toxin domain-containing protein n=1 Tax=Pantoea ananas TaxID=553 RepID=UPI0021B10B49|nr:VENN motif pre-toxin domain-containing protein [Pantoea ananatis]
MSPEQKANLSALATLASGIAAGVSSGSTAGAATGALAGKNAVENNNLAAVVRLGATACAEIASCRNMVVEKGLGALLGLGVAKTAMDNLSEADRTLILAAAMTGKADEIERLTPAQQAVYKEMVESQKGTLLPLPVLDRPLVDNTLTNPIPGQNKGTTLTTPDQRDQNGSSHNGNTSGVPDTAGNTIITPIPDGPSKDDLAYLALKGKEAQKAASDLGFGNKIPAPKVPFNSHGQPAFYNGKVYITPDIDSHNVTNSWKMFDRKGNRLGTYDSSLNRIKD